MKKYVIVVLVIFSFLSPVIMANGNGNTSNPPDNNTVIEENYLKGLQSENCGLRNSCAYFLGEIKSQKAVIPLMKILRSDKEECIRIYAALALIKIGDPRGVYLVKRTALFDDSERISKLCNQFYQAYCCEQNKLQNNTDKISVAQK